MRRVLKQLDFYAPSSSCRAIFIAHYRVSSRLLRAYRLTDARSTKAPLQYNIRLRQRSKIYSSTGWSRGVRITLACRPLQSIIISDDDDYNPDEQITSRIADAVATFGLDEKVKQPPEPEAPKPATKKPSATSLAAKANASSNSARGDLSRAEILELQQRGEVCKSCCA